MDPYSAESAYHIYIYIYIMYILSNGKYTRIGLPYTVVRGTTQVRYRIARSFKHLVASTVVVGKVHRSGRVPFIFLIEQEKYVTRFAFKASFSESVAQPKLSFYYHGVFFASIFRNDIGTRSIPNAAG